MLLIAILKSKWIGGEITFQGQEEKEILDLGAVLRVGCAFWKLSSGKITELYFTRDAILPGGRQATSYCIVQDCVRAPSA